MFHNFVIFLYVSTQNRIYFLKADIFPIIFINMGRPVGLLVDELRYKPEGRGFDSRYCHCIFPLA